MELCSMAFKRVVLTPPPYESGARREFPDTTPCIDDTYLLKQLAWMYPKCDFKRKLN